MWIYIVSHFTHKCTGLFTSKLIVVEGRDGVWVCSHRLERSHTLRSGSIIKVKLPVRPGRMHGRETPGSTHFRTRLFVARHSETDPPATTRGKLSSYPPQPPTPYFFFHCRFYYYALVTCTYIFFWSRFFFLLPSLLFVTEWISGKYTLDQMNFRFLYATGVFLTPRATTPGSCNVRSPTPLSPSLSVCLCVCICARLSACGFPIIWTSSSLNCPLAVLLLLLVAVDSSWDCHCHCYNGVFSVVVYGFVRSLRVSFSSIFL